MSPAVKKLTIYRCPLHREFWAIAVEDEAGGLRLTPSKCCGQWRTVRAFRLTERAWREAAEQCTMAADAIEAAEANG